MNGLKKVKTIEKLTCIFINEAIIFVELSCSGDFIRYLNNLERKKITGFKCINGRIQTKIAFKYNDIKLLIKMPQALLTSKR